MEIRCRTRCLSSYPSALLHPGNFVRSTNVCTILFRLTPNILSHKRILSASYAQLCCIREIRSGHGKLPRGKGLKRSIIARMFAE